MRRRNIAACALVAFATLGAGTAQAAKPQHLSRAERSLLTAINSARAAAGVPPLRASAALTSAANWQSQALARAGYLDHTSPDGSTLVDRLHARCAGAAWRRARTWPSPRRPRDAVAMWLQSPGHRENLLRPSFRTVGLGLARGVWNGRSALYVTADFGG